MAARDIIRDLLDRDPFEPFRILTSGGESFTIRDPHAIALLKSELFIAHSDSDRWTFVPRMHIAAVDKLRNDPPRRKRRK